MPMHLRPVRATCHVAIVLATVACISLDARAAEHLTPRWLRNAVFYQIYPQSYLDTNGDGIGDLPGVIEKLDYIRSLGVTAIWLNPFFVSPFNDAGYDITDFYRVAPRYGTNEDFRALCVEARRRGMRVIFDLVAGHTSLDNPWFIESRKAERNPYSDWYVWTDSVWSSPPGFQAALYPRNGGFLPNFLPTQPALNYGYADLQEPWQQPVDAPGPLAVRAEIRKIIKFWFDQGASGFRADMALSLVKNDRNREETAKFWRDIRAWIDAEYPESVLIGEAGRPTITLNRAGFHIDFTLPWSMPSYNSLFRKSAINEGGSMAGVDPYGFSVFDGMGHGNIREFMDSYLRVYEQTRAHGFITIVSGNHDLHPRISTGRSRDEILQVFLFTVTMPGVPFLYYGDEIGLRSFDGLPTKEGSYDRSEVRTPMQWDNAKPNAGFSMAPADKLYLPIDPAQDRPAVAAQERDADSLLSRMKALIALKRSHKALEADAALRMWHAEAGRMPLIYERHKDGARVIVAINPTLQPVKAIVDFDGLNSEPTTLWGQKRAFRRAGTSWSVELKPASGGIYEVPVP